jgi:hypothetical protein
MPSGSVSAVFMCSGTTPGIGWAKPKRQRPLGRPILSKYLRRRARRSGTVASAARHQSLLPPAVGVERI